MRVYWCSVHGSNAENFIARCFYSLWSNGLEPCKLREMELTLVEVEGQVLLFDEDDSGVILNPERPRL